MKQGLGCAKLVQISAARIFSLHSPIYKIVVLKTMADPLSVVGSAVGIVSLGLTLCSGLVEYYSAFKHQNAEVDSLLEKLSLLAQTLQAAQPCLQGLRSAHPNTTAQVTLCMDQCSRSISKLQHILQECRSAGSSSNVTEKIRTVFQRARYPFLKETLRSINQETAETQYQLNTALHVLQLLVQYLRCAASTLTLVVTYSSSFATKAILSWQTALWRLRTYARLSNDSIPWKKAIVSRISPRQNLLPPSSLAQPWII